MLLDLGLEFFLEAAAHPLAPLGLDFQFQFTQRITSACIRVHLLAFRLGCSHSEKEPIFPVSIMAVVSSSAQFAPRPCGAFDTPAELLSHAAAILLGIL